MTVGNALSRTVLAKFWALTATTAIFISAFVFIIDTFHLLDKEESTNPISTLGIAGEANANSVNTQLDSLVNAFDNNQLQAGKPSGNSNSGVLPNKDALVNADTKVARIMLVDLFAKRFSDNLTGITAQQKEWLIQNAHLYPADSDQKLTEIKKVCITNIKQEQITKSIDLYRQKIVSASGVVIEKLVDENSNISEMQLHILANDGGMYVVYYPQTIDVTVGESVTFYGTPIVCNIINSDMFGPVNTVLVYANYINRQIN
jgi:hypothetical protein